MKLKNLNKDNYEGNKTRNTHKSAQDNSEKDSCAKKEIQKRTNIKNGKSKQKMKRRKGHFRTGTI